MFLPFLNLRIEIHAKQKRLERVLENMILSLEPSRSKSTIDNYRTALRSLIAYAGRDATLNAVNANFLEGYQRWLQQRGVSLNTSSCYMRSLRKLLHEAGLPNCDVCFKNVFTGNTKTEKRAIAMESLNTLQTLSLPKESPLRRARDMFMFSFYAMGMPFVDLAFMRKSQLRDGYITYSRHKTGQTVRIKVVEPMQDIINMYTRKDSPYLFPFLVTTEPKAAMMEYEKLRRQYNNHLKKLADLTGLSKLTSYQVRHSWASIANAQGTDLPVISKALGHTNTQTTLIYISEIDDHRVDEANAAIVSKITGCH